MDKLLYHGRTMDMTPELQHDDRQRGVAAARAWFKTHRTVTLAYEPGDATRYRLRLIYNEGAHAVLVELHASWGTLDHDTVRAEYMYTCEMLTQAKYPLFVWADRIDRSTGRALNGWTADVIAWAVYELFSTEGGRDAFPR